VEDAQLEERRERSQTDIRRAWESTPETPSVSQGPVVKQVVREVRRKVVLGTAERTVLRDFIAKQMVAPDTTIEVKHIIT